MTRRRLSLFALGAVLVLALVLAALWLARARIAVEVAQRYFREHGVAATVEIGSLGLSGVTGRFALGPATAPEISAARLEVLFDPLSWTPRIVEVRLADPVIRARVDANGKVTLPALQSWLESVMTGRNEKSPYVSDELAVSFTGLRALLATPGGAVEIDGDARLVKNRPVAANLTVKPGTLTYQGQTLRIESAGVTLAAAGQEYRLAVRLNGAISNVLLNASGVTLTLEVPRLRLDNAVTAPTAHLHLTAKTLTASGVAVSDVALEADGQNLRADARGGEGDADLRLSSRLTLPPAMIRAIRALPLLAMDARLGNAISANLGPFALTARGRAGWHGGKLALDLPLTASARGVVLKIATLRLNGALTALSGTLSASLAGGGLPPLQVRSNRFARDEKGLRGDVMLASRFDFAALRGIDMALQGVAAQENGTFTFTLSRCVPAALQALAVLAENIKGEICPAATPAFVFDAKGWRVEAEARNVSAALPLGNAVLTGGAAHLSFAGGSPQGKVAVTAALLSDNAKPLRFNPVTASGEILFADNHWRGTIAAADPKKNALGSVTFQHAMTSGSGEAHITAPLVFVDGGLQPENISPLLVALRHAAGRAEFNGTLGWSSAGLTSRGTLAVQGFDFITPLGRAHAVDGTIALTSLLPPATAPGQELKIARIDWTLPFSAVDVRFGFTTASAQVESFQTDIAEGHVALAPFAVNPAAPGAIASAATITSLSLSPLIAASNLSGKAALTGKVSGHVPFTAGPDGFRIKDGHLTSDGPGRLSLNRSLWGDAIAANAVQDFAYQALESLAFDSMSADINSIAGGRLQIVFHIKGKSDPPKPQVAEVAVADIVNGSALQKPIPLPSGTPIDLTLDTSLNFDELLRFYAEAWSKSLSGSESGVTP